MPHPVPDRLHQILIAGSPIDLDDLPEIVQRNMRSLRECYPTADYTLWTRESIEEFLAAHFDAEVLTCFRSLVPYSYKCDLARLCIVHQLGGLYCDLGVSFMHPIEPPADFGLVAFQDVQNGSPFCFAVSPAIIWCEPGRLELKLAIDQIVQNFKERYYGPTPIYPAGPVGFGAAIVRAMATYDYRHEPNEYHIGSIRSLFPFTDDAEIFFVTPDRKIVATRTQSISRLKDDRLVTNSYGELWMAKQAYGETARNWKFTEPQIQLGPMGIRTSAGVVSRDDADGLLTFGPYIDVAPGSYRLTTILRRYDDLPTMMIEVMSGPRRQTFEDYAAGGSYRPEDFSMEFHADETLKNVEFRVFCHGHLRSEVLEFVLERLDG